MTVAAAPVAAPDVEATWLVGPGRRGRSSFYGSNGTALFIRRSRLTGRIVEAYTRTHWVTSDDTPWTSWREQRYGDKVMLTAAEARAMRKIAVASAKQTKADGKVWTYRIPVDTF